MADVEGTIRQFKFDALNEFKATGNVLDGVKVVLLEGKISDSLLPLVPADLNVSTVPGYAGAVVATWGTPFIQDDRRTALPAQSITVIATGADPSGSIGGYAFVSADNTKLIQYRNLESNRIFSATGDGLRVDPVFIYES